MSQFADYNFTRYLVAKKTVDDRALNRNVWESLKRALAAPRVTEPLRVLEIGAGIGTMVERVLEWGLFGKARYLAVDSMPENIAEAASRVPRFAAGLGFEVEQSGATEFTLIRGDCRLSATFQTADVFDFAADSAQRFAWDLLIANAFLDLVDVPSALPQLFSLLKPAGLFYFTITFDGATIFQPEIDPVLDATIEALYHEAMDTRVVKGKPSGDSRTGRHFFQHVRAAGAQLLDAGSSDWVVYAGTEGYPADEAFFLHFLINTVASALKDHPGLDQGQLLAWQRKRHDQVDLGILAYIAHQMDFLGQVP
jgi:SAM-dependent methyltransferase